MARYLAYTNALLGHLYPTVPTLLELRRRGHTVVVATAGAAVGPLRELGLDAVPVDPRLEEIHSGDWQARTAMGAFKRDLRALVRRAQVEIPDLERALAEHRPDGLIVDVTAFGASAVAERSGLPWAHVVHFPIPVPSRDVPPYGLGLTPRADALGRVRDAVVRRTLLRPVERMVLAESNPVRADLGLPLLREPADVYATAPLVLYYSAEPFEYPRSDWPATVRRVGPGVWDPPHDADVSWLDDIDAPIVLVTCSSDFQNDGRLIQVALDALADEDVFVVATSAGVDPDGFTVPRNARLARYLPHGRILSRAAAVVCHAGMGIVQKALAGGVPVCAVPFGRDQFEVARRVAVAGAGVVLSARRLSTGRLRAAVLDTIRRAPAARRVADGYAAAGGASAAADAVERKVDVALRTAAGGGGGGAKPSDGPTARLSGGPSAL
ncbi:nucleotide disphospho-sugar-binding domain-containing protein [Streptacidiphilus anmyonensis]|uniref:nucleotide disphospho-sugar-binding domain-containing protein n=1 Tax=Streptacidiphilus anmyonensis TaxID=405782 RepID=UPI000694C8F4|nr:nucleotide disphospho-sugar-binding domain-containing protein [Streptacidiphilus anmyonensis]